MPQISTAQPRTGTARNITDPNEKAKLARQIEIIKKLREHERFNRIGYYDPYPYQKRFHDTGSKGFKFVGIEREAEYVEISEVRITAC